MAKSPFKMGGFSGFGNSPAKQVSGKEYPHHATYNPKGVKSRPTPEKYGFDFKRTPTQDIKFGARQGWGLDKNLRMGTGFSKLTRAASRAGQIAKAGVRALPVIGGAVMAYDVLKTGVKRVVKGIKTGKPQTKLKGSWKRAPKKKYI